MKYLAALVLLFASVPASCQTDGEKPNTLLVHPGETIYATFERSGTMLKLLRVSRVESKGAQLVMTMPPFSEDRGIVLKVENKFDRDLTYKAEMRLLTRSRRNETSVVPVLAGKMSFEQWPYMIEELALYGFELKGQ
jgi:hypothetical protein